MLLKLIIILLTQTFGFITGVVFPDLPSAFETYWIYIAGYIQQGMSFVAVFLDIGYISQLFSWWISLGALMLTVELMMWIWKAVTGNITAEYVNESSSDGNHPSITLASGRVPRVRSGVLRLPSGRR